MGGTRRTSGKDEKRIPNFGRKPEGTGSMRRWEGNIKMNLRKLGSVGTGSMRRWEGNIKMNLRKLGSVGVV
jgi:hypothetical protein